MYKVIVICLLTSLCVFSCGSDTTQETVSENIIQVEENKQTEKTVDVQEVEQEKITESNTVVQLIETIELPQEADEVLNSLEVEEQNLILLVIGKIDKDVPERCGVREIFVYENDTQTQKIQIKDGDAQIWGIEEGYTDCLSKEETVILEDVNFDGYRDVLVWGWTPNNSIPYLCWCWNPSIEQYEYAFTLQLTDVDYETQQLVSWYKVENGLYYTDYYKVTDDNQLELVDRKIAKE